MTVDARVRAQRKRYVFDPEEGAVHRLVPHEHCWAMARNGTSVFRSAGAYCEIFYLIDSIVFSQFSPLVSHPLNHSVN
jgi:hypothetical protein